MTMDDYDNCLRENVGHGIWGVILPWVSMAILDGGWNTGNLVMDGLTAKAFNVAFVLGTLFPFSFGLSAMIIALLIVFWRDREKA